MAEQLDEPRARLDSGDPELENPYASPAPSQPPQDEYITHSAEKLNPWISMWMNPRATVRQMLETDPTRHLLLLATLGGIGFFLDQLIYMSLGEDFSTRVMLLMVLLVGGAVVGVVALYLYSLFLRMGGRMLGGVGTAAGCRTAFAWSNIPTVWLVPVYLCLAVAVVTVGSDALLSDTIAKLEAGADYSIELLPTWLKAISALAVVSRLWQIVLTCQAIGEAHQMSSGKGLLAFIIANLMLSGVVVVGVIALQLLLMLAGI